MACLSALEKMNPLAPFSGFLVRLFGLHAVVHCGSSIVGCAAMAGENLFSLG